MIRKKSDPSGNKYSLKFLLTGTFGFAILVILTYLFVWDFKEIIEIQDVLIEAAIAFFFGTALVIWIQAVRSYETYLVAISLAILFVASILNTADEFFALPQWLGDMDQWLTLIGLGVFVIGMRRLRSQYLSLVVEERESRKIAEEAGLRYKALFEQANDAVFVETLNGKILEVNQKACNLLGYTHSELEKLSVSDIVPPDIRERLPDIIEEEVLKGDFRIETEIVGKDGTSVPVEVSTSLMEIGDQQLILAIVRDITDRKNAEKEKERLHAQLLQSQKLEAVGTLAGGVAHDFNNMLTAIMGFTELSMMKIDENDPIYKNLENIRGASAKASDITRQLLAFSRKQPMEFNIVDLNKTITDLLKMLKRLIGEDMSIQTELGNDIWSVWVDTGNIEQVIVNLALNARDAMPTGGQLSIKTENVIMSEDDLEVMPDASLGKYVCMVIQDDGHGIPKETLPHIFEPFFTTKVIGKGSGLGLAVVYGIVKQHGGWIDIYSEPGHGSTFKVYLPANFQKKVLSKKEMPSIQNPQGNGERVLIVEDDEQVRKIVSATLGDNGYQIFTTLSVQEALEVFESEKGNFQLVFSDVVLPDNTGLDLVEQLLLIKPNLKILLGSGYTDKKSRWEDIRRKQYPFIQKPYELAKLLCKVREVLDADK